MKNLKQFRYADLVKLRALEPVAEASADPSVPGAPSGGTTVVSGYHDSDTMDSSGTTDTSGTRGTTKENWRRPNLDQFNLKISKANTRQIRDDVRRSRDLQSSWIRADGRTGIRATWLYPWYHG